MADSLRLCCLPLATPRPTITPAKRFWKITAVIKLCILHCGHQVRLAVNAACRRDTCSPMPPSPRCHVRPESLTNYFLAPCDLKVYEPW